MKPIKAKKEFNMNGIAYVPGDDVKPEDINILVKLNERGFIEPMTLKEMQDYFNKPIIDKPIINRITKPIKSKEE